MSERGCIGKKIIDLTEEEDRAFRMLGVCKRACHEAVRAGIREWEKAAMCYDELWSSMARKYGILLGDGYIYHEGAIHKYNSLGALADDTRDAMRAVDALLNKLSDGAGG